jgi:hypothetical protein
VCGEGGGMRMFALVCVLRVCAVCDDFCLSCVAFISKQGVDYCAGGNRLGESAAWVSHMLRPLFVRD